MIESLPKTSNGNHWEPIYAVQHEPSSDDVWIDFDPGIESIALLRSGAQSSSGDVRITKVSAALPGDESEPTVGLRTGNDGRNSFSLVIMDQVEIEFNSQSAPNLTSTAAFML